MSSELASRRSLSIGHGSDTPRTESGTSISAASKNIIITTIVVLFAGFVVAVLAFNLSGTASESTNNNSTVASSEQLEMHEEYDLPEENRFVKEPADEIVNRFSSGTGVIFLGFEECPWCQKTVPLLNQAAEAEDVSIYYLDIREERENLTSDYQELVSILSPYLPKDEDGAVRISTPDISFVRDGEIIWRYEMEPTTEAERTPETYWTEERKERAVKRFKEEMQGLK